MKPNQPIFTDYLDKSVYFKQILKHIDTLSYNGNGKFKNSSESFYLWATETPNGDFNIRSLSSRDAAKDILFSSSSDVNPAIARIFDQILFDSAKKFGGSSIYARNLINKLIDASSDKDTNTFHFDKTLNWLRILFEEVVPRHLAEFAVPNTSVSFANAAEHLYEQYDPDLVTNVLKAVIEAGSGGNIIVKQSPYYETFSISQGQDGYQFKTLEPSKIFAGLTKFQMKPAISFTNPRVLAINGSLDEVTEIEEILEESARSGQPLVIIANRISDEVYDVLRLNFDKGHLNCFGAEVKNDYESINTCADIGIISGEAPITPFSMHSEFLMAQWDKLPTVQEVTFFRDGKFNIKNEKFDLAVRNHVKKLAERRQQLTAEEYNIKEPNLTARIQNLTTSPVTIFVPYRTEAEGESKRIQVDTIIKYLKSIITYGMIDLSQFDFEKLYLEFVNVLPKKDLTFYENHDWFFKELMESFGKESLPYLYIIGSSRLVATRIAQIIGVGGMVVTTD